MLNLAAMIAACAAACAGTPERPACPDPNWNMSSLCPPAWLEQPCAVRDGAVYAVGSSNFNDSSARFSDVQLSARGALVACLAGLLTHERDAQGNTRTTLRATMNARGSEIVSRWYDAANGTEYALARLPLDPPELP
jgi:hypothetical protein